MTERPIVTTLCGSTRFPDAFALANMHLSMQGRIVIGLGMLGHTDGGDLVRKLYGHRDEHRARDRVRQAYERHGRVTPLRVVRKDTA